MPEHEASQTPYNPFDLTKVWPHGDYPLIDVGYFELNRNPDNYFSEVEQVAMNPANVVPGISFSPDKMLQGRLFSYGDAHRYRLGVNHHQIPVNGAKCPFHNYHRDGAMRVDGNSGNGATYEPNSFGLFQEQPDFSEPPLSIEGAADHWNHREDDDYYSQPRAVQPAERRRAPAHVHPHRRRTVAGAGTSSAVRSSCSPRCTRTTAPASPRRWG